MRLSRSLTFVLWTLGFQLTAQAVTCSTIGVGPATALPAATVGQSYEQAFEVTGGTAPYQFSVTSGLPAGTGLTLTASGPDSADLTGSPLQAGAFVITVSATDSAGCLGGRTYALSVGLGAQTVSFTSTPPASTTVGGAAYTPIAQSSSGLPVSVTVDPSSDGACTISAGAVSFTGAGTCVIDANQAGDANYSAAPQVQQSIAVGKQSQSITFTSTAPPSAVVGGPPYAVNAATTSGLQVTFTVDAAAASVCSVAGNAVSFNAAGTCVIDANQAGNATYAAAPQVQQSFAVIKQPQSITFTSTPPASATVGGPSYTVSAIASSGLPVSLTIDAVSAGTCAIAGAVVSFSAAGTCVLDANQPGNAIYSAAAQVQQSFAVSNPGQTITFTSTSPSNASVGGPTYTPTATASSGLPVSITVDAASATICSIAAGVVTFNANGSCVLDANQPGNGTYTAAPQVQQTVLVGIVLTARPYVMILDKGNTNTFTSALVDSNGNVVGSLPATFSAANPTIANVNASTGATVAGSTYGSTTVSVASPGYASGTAYVCVTKITDVAVGAHFAASIASTDPFSCVGDANGSPTTSYYADIYRITMTAGQTLSFKMDSGNELDTYLLLSDANGVLVAGNDDDPTGSLGVGSNMMYTAAATGVYYVEASTFSGLDTGNYTFIVEAP